MVAVGVSQKEFLQQRIRDAEAKKERLLKEKAEEKALRLKLAILEDDIVTLQAKNGDEDEDPKEGDEMEDGGQAPTSSSSYPCQDVLIVQ